MQSSARDLQYQQVDDSRLLSLDTLDITFKMLRPVHARAALEVQNLRQKGIRVNHRQIDLYHVDWDLDKVAAIIRLLTLVEAPKRREEQLGLNQAMDNWVKLGRQLLAG